MHSTPLGQVKPRVFPASVDAIKLRVLTPLRRIRAQDRNSRLVSLDARHVAGHAPARQGREPGRRREHLPGGVHPRRSIARSWPEGSGTRTVWQLVVRLRV